MRSHPSLATISIVVLSVIFIYPAGCSPSIPLVADPPSGAPTLPEVTQDSYARGRMNPEGWDEGLDDPHHNQPFQGLVESRESETTLSGIVVNVVAFPFRAVGWLIQQIF
jgi:hypothetical protein